MGFLLAAVSVFLRDMFYIYGIVLSLWMYLTPVMYDVSAISQPLVRFVLTLNPLYHLIGFARTVILRHETPGLPQFVACAVPALLALAVGAWVFRKNQDSFVYYM